MNFHQLVEELLNELSAKEIYQKYYNKIEYNIFLDIVQSDPQTVSDGGEIKKLGKYSKLLILLYQKGGLQLEDLDKATEYLEYVYEHKIPLDINKIKTLVDLYDVVKEYIAKDAKSFQEVLNVLPQNEYELLYDGKNWQFYKPLTEKASCYLGTNTEWCTTWGPYSLNKKYRDRGNMFQRHHTQGPLFIIVNKNDTNEKYQFHFETNQFMDKDDRRIKTSEFLKDNDKKEILYFFFPSFYREATSEELKIEMKRIDLLPEEMGVMVFDKAVENVDNKLVNAIFKKETEVLSQVLPDADDIDISDGRVIFILGNLSDDLENLNQNVGWYEYEANNGWDFIYEDMRDRGLDEYETERLQEFIEGYYEKNKDVFKENFGTRDFGEFLKTFYDNFIHNEKTDIQDSFWSDIADLSYRGYEENNESLVDEIKKDIYIDGSSGGGYEVSVNQVKFIQYLLKKNIQIIGDEDELFTVLDGYVDYCGHGGEFERIYDHNIFYPKYDGNNNCSRTIEKYFDDLILNAEEHSECIQLRKKLNEIVEKYFKNSTTFENDHIRVRLKSMEINCETGMVKIEYKNKDTGESYGGWGEKDGVKIDNLVSLLTNYKLFESYIRFKKNIIK